MRVLENGIVRDMTAEEIAEFESNLIKPSYKESIINAIREKYSIDDEIAILRQRDTKPNEFDEYFNFVENIKENLKNQTQEEGE